MLEINFVLVLFFVGVQCCGDYYWREYNGRIPIDAIPAGNHTDGGIAYIGQAYIHKFGLYLGTIIPGKMEITVPCYGVKRTDIIIKILCARDSSKYEWVQTTRDSYAKNITDRCPVVGGYDQKVKDIKDIPLGTLHVGRINLFGNAIIGNIAFYNPQDVWFYYPVNYDEKKADTFEVLLFDNDDDVEYISNKIS